MIKIKFRPDYCPFLFEEAITDGKILDSIKEEEIFGMFSVDISTPENIIPKLEKFPPIFKKVSVTADMVNEKMRNGKFPREVNTMCFNADNILLTTNLLRFYLEIGLKGQLKIKIE